MSINALKRLICAALAALLLCCGAVVAAAEDTGALIDSAVGRQLKAAQAEDVQHWIDSALTDGAGVGAEWYVIALSGLGEYDFSRYSAALANYMENAGAMSATSRQKCAIALQCAGYSGEYISQTPERTIGKQGVMSFIFGLHVLNNMDSAAQTGRALDGLLALRLEDGGWALYGDVSDVDVTAMAVQALSPHTGAGGDVDVAVAEALALLSERQLDDGGYSGFGEENAESCAQVIMALSSMGIDCRTDERFIKNGRSALDALLGFRLENGGFAHERNGEENGAADIQALCALVSLKKGNIYLAKAPQGEITINESAAGEEKKTPGYKFWAVTGMACACALFCAATLIKNLRGKNPKKALKNCVAAVVLCGLLAAAAALTDIKSAGEFYSGAEVSESVGQVTLSISCGSVAGRNGLPEDGVLLAEQSFDIAEGDTVYELLVRAARRHRIQTDASGTGELIYVAGIANLYEFDYGDLSGWVYTVNGEMPSVGCGAFVLSDGDEVAWIYTVDMGRELG